MSFVIAILGLAFLILIHEAGHFFAARAVGMRPRKFYIGFGPAIAKTIPGCKVRPALPADLAGCNALCLRVHGHHRGGELADAIAQNAASVVERSGRLTGYATPVAFFGHAVGETNDDLKALIASALSFPGPGLLVPSRNGELMRWSLAQGLRIVQSMTLMTMGLYNEPSGAWLPSVLY